MRHHNPAAETATYHLAARAEEAHLLGLLLDFIESQHRRVLLFDEFDVSGLYSAELLDGRFWKWSLGVKIGDQREERDDRDNEERGGGFHGRDLLGAPGVDASEADVLADRRDLRVDFRLVVRDRRLLGGNFSHQGSQRRIVTPGLADG